MQTTCTQPYTTQATPSASAVNIQIFEPKAYAGQPAEVQNPIYSYPAQSVYAQPYVNQYQQYIPQQIPQYQQCPQYPQQQYIPQQQAVQTQPVPQQPMPAPVLTQPQTQTTQLQEQQVQPQESDVQQTAQEQAAPNIDVVEPQQENQTGVDVNSLIAGLQSTDNKAQEEAITAIANLSQGDPSMQNAVLSEPVMTGLADIIKQDTSNLQGPSDAQIAAINKAASGAQLTPEEEALTKELAPKTAADKNRVISMFTLAMLQKNQRDEIDRYNETQDEANKLPQIKINDLIGFNEIENAARNESDKEVKLGAIQALAYAARPEDKETLEPIMTAAAQDSEPLIQQAANEVLANIGSTQSAPVGTAQTVDVAEGTKKLSRKERKAAEKAAKEAQKQAQVAA